MIIGRIENCGDGERFSDKKILAFDNAMCAVDDSPANVINKGLCDGYVLLLVGSKAHSVHKGKGCGFGVKDEIVYCFGCHKVTAFRFLMGIV